MGMEQRTIRNTYKYKLKPTPEQERVLAEVLWRCRVLYNAALEQRKTWWGRGQGKSATYYQQKAELPDLKAAFPEYGGAFAGLAGCVVARRACVSGVLPPGAGG